MMKIWWLEILLAVLVLINPVYSHAMYETERDLGVQWISGNQNADGSWGDDAAKHVYTAEVVRALRAAGQKNYAYFQGIAWLENHQGANFDFSSRQAAELLAHGDDTGVFIAALEASQDSTAPGHSGWGMSDFYFHDPLDTALALATLNHTSSSADMQVAIDFLKNNQLTGANQGWGIGTQNSYDAFTTAVVSRVLAGLQDMDSSLTVVVTNAVATLASTVGPSSPAYLQALAAEAALAMDDSTTAQVWLDNLAITQSANGDINNDIYSTSLTLRTFAAADGIDDPNNQNLVYVPDSQLLKAINMALDRNSQDNVNRNDLTRLTSLNASGMGIADLTGLEYAVNLQSADLSNNNIIDTTPIDELALLADLNLDGNPVSAVVAVPSVNGWGKLLVFSLLFVIALKHLKSTPPYRAAA